MTYQPIENYGVIGDMHSVALVGMDGSIDYMCYPYFDSPSIFAALLDDQKGGRFKIAPINEDYRPKQLYLPDTNVLLTRFLSYEGVAEIADFMPIEEGREKWHDLVRRVKTVRGTVHYRLIFAPRFDYARVRHRVEECGVEAHFIPDSGDNPPVCLCAPVEYRIVDGDLVAEFTLGAGETLDFVMRQPGDPENALSRHPDYGQMAFDQTVDFWRNWIGRSTYRGRWREMVNRSALVLKMLTSAQHGSLVASPTFSLPETIGGARNWDYRYTWIRDASFTLYALIRLGLTQETVCFMQWIEDRCRELSCEENLQIMYGIDGRSCLDEITLDHLEGYRGSRPVRIGNAAWKQLQLDIYGELMDSVYLVDKYARPIHYDLWRSMERLMNWLCDNWRRPDEGIWEVRGGPREFLFSRVMCWVALDRAVRLANKRSFPAPLEHWINTRNDIYHEIMKEYWHADRQAFSQYKGSTEMDASCLLMPLVRFISPTDPRWLSTLRAIEEDLVSDSLVFRYRVGQAAPDGLETEEGTFTMCSFWYAECLSRSNDLQKARLVLEKALGYANHVGLYAEQLGRRGEHLGNYPQAFTHLALISATYDLNRRLDRAGESA